MRALSASPAVVILSLAALAAGCGGDADVEARDLGHPEATEVEGARTGAASATPAGGAPDARPPDSSPEVLVHKSPTCGCCVAWIEHLEAAGFRVTAHDEADLETVKNRLGIPGPVRSCHTAVVDGYLVEGHVPADVLRRLLAERPEVAGVAVPGMPIGSPGMEVPGRPADPYQVLTFDGNGRTEVYESR